MTEQILDCLKRKRDICIKNIIPSQTCSASRSEITVEEPLADLESTETWQKFHGHAIVAGQRLQEKINESVTCRFCQESVELVENLGSKNRLGSIWMFQCQNESCPSHETNLPFPTMEKKQGARDKLCIGSWLSWSIADKQKMQCIPATSRVKIWPAAYHPAVKCPLLLQDDPSLVNIKMDD